MGGQLDRTDPGSIGVLVADDEPEVRAALAELIEAEPGLRLVGTARDAEEAVELAGRSRPDVALVDVRMPGGGGPPPRRPGDPPGLPRDPRPRALGLRGPGDGPRDAPGRGRRRLVKGTPPAEIVRAIARASVGQTSLSAEVMPGVVQELSAQLRLEELALEERRARRERIRRAISGEGLSLVFQPIFDLRDRRTVGMEALARFSLDPARSPAAWFSEATREGLGVDLELTAVRLALAELDRIPRDAYLSLNLSHATALSGRTRELLSGADEMGMAIVAEGIETRAELDTLLRLGVGCGQGFFLAKPAPLPAP